MIGLVRRILVKPWSETRYGCLGFRAGGFTKRRIRVAVPHSENTGSSGVGDGGFVMGTAATTGKASDCSMSARMDSPASLERGKVNLEAGRRTMGWGRGRTGSLDGVISDGRLKVVAQALATLTIRSPYVSRGLNEVHVISESTVLPDRASACWFH
jgi:hypothetical protein